MATNEMTRTEGTEIVKATVAENFVKRLEKLFSAEVGNTGAEWNVYERTLAQHLFVSIDRQLATLEANRKDGVTPYNWNNVNLPKLALDAKHTINLGLDAAIPGHVWPVPFKNSKTGQYDITLMPGAVGIDYFRHQNAIDPPIKTIYRLVYTSDHFEAIDAEDNNGVESYKHRITDPFNRGKVRGGFAYMKYDEPAKNRLIIVEPRVFKKARAAAKSGDFWGPGYNTVWGPEPPPNFPEGAMPEDKFEIEMLLKTVVRHAASKIALDPKKVNSASFAAIMEVDAGMIESEVADDVAANANRTVIDAAYHEEPNRALGDGGEEGTGNREVDSEKVEEAF